MVEDIVRFYGEHKKICSDLKRQRHTITKNCDILLKPYMKGFKARDVSQDPGRRLGAKLESRRYDLRDVLIANFRRSEESLRVLEEMAKLIDAKVSRAFKRSRFRIYDIEKKCMLSLEL